MIRLAKWFVMISAFALVVLSVPAANGQGATSSSVQAGTTPDASQPGVQAGTTPALTGAASATPQPDVQTGAAPDVTPSLRPPIEQTKSDSTAAPSNANEARSAPTQLEKDKGSGVQTPSAKADEPGSAVLKQTIQKDSSAQEGSVESFFQINPQTRNSRQNLLMQPAVVPPKNKANRSVPHYAYRFVWHVLDNLGVPMFFGHDSPIDPSITGTYVIQSPKLPRERAVAKELEKSISQSRQPVTEPTTSQPVPAQKIPESELEGVKLPTPRDANAPKP